jgi:hypothetical protein
MPVNPQGSFTVDQINNNPNEPVLYGAYKLLDSGTITKGSEPVDVVTADVIVWHQDSTFGNYGNRIDVPDYYYHIRISDKTVQEVNQYLESFNKKLTYASDQFDPATDLRRFTTTNVRVSASGNNGFTEQGILDVHTSWNAEYPDNQITLIDTDNLTYFQSEGIMPKELFDAYQAIAQENALGDYYARRRWYIIESGMVALENNEGVISGTASDVDQYLRDGLLD